MRISPERMRQLALWISIAALLSLPFIISLVPHRSARSQELSPTQLMAQAVLYANESLHELSKAMSLYKPSEKALLDARSAENVSAALAEKAAKMPTTGFAGLIRRAMTSYSLLANASSHNLLAAPRLYKGLTRARDALDALAKCRVTDYLREYNDSRQDLLLAEKQLTESLNQLIDLNTSYLLSSAHEDVARNLTAATAEALKAIYELEKLYHIVLAHKDLVQALCHGDKNIDKKRLLGLLRELSGLNPENAGPLGYDEAVAVMHLVKLAQGGQGGSCAGGSSGTGGGGNTSSNGAGNAGEGAGGSGAGYGAPSSDD